MMDRIAPASSHAQAGHTAKKCELWNCDVTTKCDVITPGGCWED